MCNSLFCRNADNEFADVIRVPEIGVVNEVSGNSNSLLPLNSVLIYTVGCATVLDYRLTQMWQQN